ncbi:MAG: LacI family DNA-binding transcriptional regulator, partial [Victivallales bacterium]|nr:LacI family DNA-binding transcriptional regulator [Victivallales bacterium]
MPRMLDIAHEADVSRTVVSLVLNGRGDQLGIAKQTQEKVLAIAASMGYYRNELAAATASRRGRI